MKVKEKFSLFGLLIPMALAFITMYGAIISKNPTLGVLAIMFAWQAGWSVKLSVEIDKFKENHE